MMVQLAGNRILMRCVEGLLLVRESANCAVDSTQETLCSSPRSSMSETTAMSSRSLLS